jgi:L-iditol 2-dehydrogenase
MLGDRVTIEPGVPCLKCEYCLTGRYNLCNSVKFIGAPPHHGTFREYVNHKGLFVHKLPDSVSYEEGACVEPLAVGFHSVSRAGIRPGEKVLVTGAGPIGVLVMMFARLAGGEVTVSDVDDYRITVAGEMGADETINSGNHELPMNTYNCIIEATGNTKIYPSIIGALKKGGRLVIVGMSNTAPTVDMTALMRKEAEIITVYRYANCFHPVLRLLEKGRIDVKALVSHRFPLTGIADAFNFVDDPSQNKVKVMVSCSGGL